MAELAKPMYVKIEVKSFKNIQFLWEMWKRSRSMSAGWMPWH